MQALLHIIYHSYLFPLPRLLRSAAGTVLLPRSDVCHAPAATICITLTRYCTTAHNYKEELSDKHISLYNIADRCSSYICSTYPAGPKETNSADLAPLNTCTTHSAGPKTTISDDLAPLNTCDAHPAESKWAISPDLTPLNTCSTHPAGPKETNSADLAPP